MGVGLQTLNNQLRTLYLRGYLSQDASRCYRLGPQCFYLGSFADRWSGLRSAVVEPLGRLVRETGLAGFAGVVENDKMLAVALLNPGETASPAAAAALGGGTAFDRPAGVCCWRP